MQEPRRTDQARQFAAAIVRRLFRPGLIGNLGSNGLGQAVQIGLQLLTVPLYSRFLGLERYGVWLMFITVPAYLAFSDFGLTAASGGDMIARVARGDRAGAARTYRIMRRRLMIAGLCAAAVLMAGAAVPGTLAFAADACQGQPALVLAAMLLYSLGLLHCAGTFAAFRAVGGYAGASYRMQGIALLEALAAAALAAMGGGLAGMALAYAGARMAGAAWLWLVLRRRNRFFFEAWDGGGPTRPGALAAPALAALTLSLAAMMGLQGVVGLVGALAGAAAVPAFAAARTMTRVPLQLALMVNAASLPEFAASKARGDEGRAADLVALTLLALPVVLLPGAAALAAFGPALLDLWTGGRIHASGALLGWLLAAMLANGCWVGLSNFLLSLNRQADFSYAYLALVLAGSVAAIWLLPLYGATGAAFVVAMIDCAMLGLVVRQTVRRGLFGMALVRSVPARCAAMLGKV